MRLGELVRTERLRRNLSQEALGALVDLDRSEISRIESGGGVRAAAPLTAARVKALATALGQPLGLVTELAAEAETAGSRALEVLPADRDGADHGAPSTETIADAAVSGSADRLTGRSENAPKGQIEDAGPCEPVGGRAA